jgi:hypothetical protein
MTDPGIIDVLVTLTMIDEGELSGIPDVLGTLIK